MTAATQWMVKGGRNVGSAPFLVAGIVNVTPDSFSDGGRYADPAAALTHARLLATQGADILDIGGESTRPGSDPVTPEEELARVLPVVRGVVAWRHDLPAEAGPAPTANGAAIPRVSVDTWRASTAEAVLNAGADIINDVSGGTFDPSMADVLARHAPGYVLTHCPAPPATMRRHAVYADVTAAVLEFFERRMEVLIRAGLPESNIALDPGIGFGKTAAQNLELLSSIERLQSLHRPLYIGVSRKMFLGELLGLAPGDRDAATGVLTALLAERGVTAHRVHNVAGAVAALRLVEKIGKPR